MVAWSSGAWLSCDLASQCCTILTPLKRLQRSLARLKLCHKPVCPQVLHRHQLEHQADAIDQARLQLCTQQQQQQPPAALHDSSSTACQQQGVQQLHVDVLVQQLEQSQQDLRAALAAAAEAQQEARQLRRQLSMTQERQTAPAANHSSSSPFAKAAASGFASKAMSEQAQAARIEAGLATENKQLVEQLAATHHKLKQLRAKGQQREAVQQAQVWGPGSCHSADALSQAFTYTCLKNVVSTAPASVLPSTQVPVVEY
jgi:hypothetical protein